MDAKNKEIINKDGCIAFKRPIAADKDFTDLRGKVLEIELNPGEVYGCVVDDIDYDIGISLSFAELTEEQFYCLKGLGAEFKADKDGFHNDKIYAICLNGPSAAEFDGVWAPHFYNSRFFNIVSGLRKGLVDCRFIDALHDMRPKHPIEALLGGDMAPCAFS